MMQEMNENSGGSEMPVEEKDPQQLAEEQAMELLQKPIDFYYSERSPEDKLDLVKEVRDRMVNIGLKDKLEECFDNNRFVIEAQGRPSHAQQFNLTRYFATQLMATPNDTTQERFSLMYEVRPDQWLTVFEQKILPAIVDNNLPVKL